MNSNAKGREEVLDNNININKNNIIKRSGTQQKQQLFHFQCPTSSSSSSTFSQSFPPFNSIHLFCLLLVFTFGIQLIGACPSDCSCKWKGGKQSVECINRGFRTFPGPIESSTQVLDLSGNSFETLPSDHFMRLSLINLQKIYLPRCRLTSINSRAFRGLSNLVEMDLSHNVLREVPSSTFPDCQGLMRLFLSGNPISQLQRNAFMHLEALTTLEMNHCAIELIEKGAFEGLISLEWLKLNGNKLKRLQGLDALPLALKGVWLEQNPWECDCRLLELRLWLEERKVANSVEPRCATPNRLINQTLSSLSLDHFACTPELSPTTMYQKIGEGKNVSLLCKVTSTPESSLEWWFNGQPVSNSSFNMLIETTSSIPTIFSSSSSLISSSSSSTSLASFSPNGAVGGSIEKKSELLILNATAEENGTFLCVAKNPSGMAFANFTIRVLSNVESDSYSENSLSLVGSYPNIFLIIVSTGAVIGVVIVVFVSTMLVCKCSRLCRSAGQRGGRESRAGNRGRHKSGGAGSNSEGSVGDGNRKDGKDLHNSSGKLDRHLSETSTLTTQTKSNGSVFLLSTSSELGDSNPDIIEGVKRVEADGHETCFSNIGNGNVYAQAEMSLPLPQMMTLGLPHLHHMANSPNVIVNPNTDQQNPYSTYPQDFGLPTNLNVSTLVRRSPSYQLSPGNMAVNNHSQPQHHHQQIPPTYDLAKYPKEYINPSHPTYLTYGPPPPGSLIYTTHDPSSSSSDSYNQAQVSYPYIIPPPGTYVYHSGPDDYVMSMGMEMPLSITMDPMGGTYVEIPTSSAPLTCSCGPILESNEEGDESEQVNVDSVKVSMSNSRDKSTTTSSFTPQPPQRNSSSSTDITGTISASKYNNHNASHSSSSKPSSVSCTSTSTTMNSNVNLTPMSSSSPSTSSSSTSKSSSSVGSATGKSETVKTRLQRQFTTQINESPDEGYEDESAEGTEI